MFTNQTTHSNILYLLLHSWVRNWLQCLICLVSIYTSMNSLFFIIICFAFGGFRLVGVCCTSRSSCFWCLSSPVVYCVAIIALFCCSCSLFVSFALLRLLVAMFSVHCFLHRCTWIWCTWVECLTKTAFYLHEVVLRFRCTPPSLCPLVGFRWVFCCCSIMTQFFCSYYVQFIAFCWILFLCSCLCFDLFM